MKKWIAMLVLCSLVLSGCASLIPDRTYVSVTPHEGQDNFGKEEPIAVNSSTQLRVAMLEAVAQGEMHFVFSTEQIADEVLVSALQEAITYTMQMDAIGAYAVENITYERGTHAGIPAVAVNVDYRHNKAEIQRIKQAEDMDAAKGIVEAAIDQFESSVVVRVTGYQDMDFVQYVSDYADSYPELVMEKPKVKASVYPETGSVRVIELKFSYQTGRETMRNMRTFVQPIFVGAGNYVGSEGKDSVKFDRLYTYLMDRAEYTIGSSTTPAYTLLQNGICDSRTMALVFASMSRWAGLECQIVEGTRDGAVWYWNIICQNGVYYHVDLLRCEEVGKFLRESDVDMAGYEWDREAFPVCGIY